MVGRWAVRLILWGVAVVFVMLATIVLDADEGPYWEYGAVFLGVAALCLVLSFVLPPRDD